MRKNTTSKRFTYSINPEAAQVLGKASIEMTHEKGMNVHRQDILDELVLLLKDKTVFERISSRFN